MCMYVFEELTLLSLPGLMTNHGMSKPNNHFHCLLGCSNSLLSSKRTRQTTHLWAHRLRKFCKDHDKTFYSHVWRSDSLVELPHTNNRVHHLLPKVRKKEKLSKPSVVNRCCSSTMERSQQSFSRFL